jgi:hypothetical protein
MDENQWNFETITPLPRSRSVKYHDKWSWRAAAQASEVCGCSLAGTKSQTLESMENYSSVHRRTCQSPASAAHWLVEKLSTFPSRRVCCDHYPKQCWSHVRLGLQVLIHRVWDKQFHPDRCDPQGVWSDSMEFSTPPGLKDLTWFKKSYDSLRFPRSVISTTDQSGHFLQGLGSRLLRTGGVGQFEAFIAC